jgi:hypothetical protein
LKMKSPISQIKISFESITHWLDHAEQRTSGVDELSYSDSNEEKCYKL